MVSRENSFVSESRRPVDSESLPFAAISATRDCSFIQEKMETRRQNGQAAK